MAEAGQELGAGDDFRLRLVETGEDVLKIEATYSGSAGLPPEHLHPNQDERFEVLEGAMRAIIDGSERRYEVGEVFEVPADTPHQMAADGPSRVSWEVRPALRTAEFFERLLGDGPDSAQAAASFADFMAEFDAEIRFTG